jgi:hypothetical protein
MAACAAAIACGLPIEGDFDGDVDGVWAGCGCAHAPSSKAATSTAARVHRTELVSIIVLVSL